MRFPQGGESPGRDALVTLLQPCYPCPPWDAAGRQGASPCSPSCGRGHNRADQSCDERADKRKKKEKKDRQIQKQEGKPLGWLLFPPAPGIHLWGQNPQAALTPSADFPNRALPILLPQILRQLRVCKVKLLSVWARATERFPCCSAQRPFWVSLLTYIPVSTADHTWCLAPPETDRRTKPLVG